MQRKSLAPAIHGIAQELHLAPRITGSDDQQVSQQEPFRARHGSSSLQMTHGECRTIRAVSRPNISRVETTANIVAAVRGPRSAVRGFLPSPSTCGKR